MQQELTPQEMQHINGGSSTNNHSDTYTVGVGHTIANSYDDGRGNSVSGSASVAAEISVSSSNDRGE